MNNCKLIIFICIALIVGNTFAQEHQTGAPEVYQHAEKVLRKLKDIGDEMGIDIAHGKNISVSNVSFREVFFQAATLHKKTSRLMFEFTSQQGNPVVDLKPNAKSEDVMGLLLSIEEHLDSVGTHLKINKTYTLATLDSNRTPNDIFRLIVNLNRSTNRLLDFKFTPAESHQKITESIALTNAILATHPRADLVFPSSVFESKKTPTDVYQRIARMYTQMVPLMTRLNKSCLVLGEQELHREGVVHSDVYDLAVLVTAQFHYLHSLTPNVPTVKNSYYPGKVISSDVYQRLSILDKQLNELLRLHNITPIQF